MDNIRRTFGSSLDLPDGKPYNRIPVTNLLEKKKVCKQIGSRREFRKETGYMRTKGRILSLLLCGAMLFSPCAPSLAAGAQVPDGTEAVTDADGLCGHHTEHTKECGYTEEMPGTPCGFVCAICNAEAPEPSNEEKADATESAQPIIDTPPDAVRDEQAQDDAPVPLSTMHDISTGPLHITVDGEYTVTGSTNVNNITVAAGVGATIILSDVTIDVSGKNLTSAIDMDSAGACTITLAEGTTNTLKAGEDRPGIHVPNGEPVTLNGTGTLHVEGSASWPGIGRTGNGDIRIESGTITSRGAKMAQA